MAARSLICLRACREPGSNHGGCGGSSLRLGAIPERQGMRNGRTRSRSITLSVSPLMEATWIRITSGAW